nr:MAG TPA: hypothetical protein [Caudoviricetes sp.]
MEERTSRRSPTRRTYLVHTKNYVRKPASHIVLGITQTILCRGYS